MIRSIGKTLDWAASMFNGLSAAAVVFIMLLTCADVVLRFFGRPVPGAYELVGYSGAVIVAFALARTSVERGHIAVELLVDRLPGRPRSLVEAVGSLAGAVLFGLLTWQSRVYASDLMESGDVSLTLGMPTWPFVYAVGAGTALLTAVLLLDALRHLKRGFPS
ncbi:MAG: TRAP transporter small permease [Syntrophobacterales bacterium]|nr:TRAP transporter small permease [Syntrophobacterales bacterium]